MAVLLLCARHAFAQPVGKATTDFPNLKAGRNETPWGRLVADALRSTGKADLAVVNAGALRPRTLEAGPIEVEDISGLLSFGDDEVVTLTLSGTQLRAALERAASTYPTGSPAFLHCSGLNATFDPEAEPGRRVGPIRVKNHAIAEQETFSVAMPVSLSEGAAGYFNIWSGAQARRAGSTLLDAIAGYIRGKGDISPDGVARFGPK